MTFDRTSDARIYLDHAATTPLHPEVRRAMLSFQASSAANPSSLHEEGREARERLEEARSSILRTLDADGFELVFTSGGTESNQSALVGAVLGREAGPSWKVVASAVEHPSVLEAAAVLDRLGARLVVVPVDRDGRVDLDALRSEVDPDVALVSIQSAGNETGVVQPLEEVLSICASRGVPLHTDAVQGLASARRVVVGQDLLTLSAHKVGGPKGVGALLLREGTPWASLLRGGQQERGRRAGTENVAGAIGFARAVEVAFADRDAEVDRLVSLQEAVRAELSRAVADLSWNTPGRGALPHILQLSIPGAQGESLVRLLDHLGIAASTGSACNIGAKKASHVLAAMGRSEEQILGAVRLSFGHQNTIEQVPEITRRFARAVEQLRAISGYESGS